MTSQSNSSHLIQSAKQMHYKTCGFPKQTAGISVNMQHIWRQVSTKGSFNRNILRQQKEHLNRQRRLINFNSNESTCKWQLLILATALKISLQILQKLATNAKSVTLQSLGGGRLSEFICRMKTTHKKVVFWLENFVLWNMNISLISFFQRKSIIDLFTINTHRWLFQFFMKNK